LAEALDGGENLVGGFYPFVELGVFIVSRNERSAVDFEFSGGSMDAAL
jgi:hypothetical protein